ncbi:MAG TPA: tetratricopeptide repeat protein [Planctomycetes bacterium]|nr:tetratricopeptide repeat protein [Planctomycetota bacterium]
MKSLSRILVLFLGPLLLGACGAVLPPPRERVRDLPTLSQGAARKKTAEMLAYGKKILDKLPKEASNERLELLEEAETAFLTARHYAPENPEVYLALGRLYEVDGHLEAALENYREVLGFSALDPKALYHAARLATNMGREREAAKYLVALRTIPEMKPRILILEARVYLVLAQARDQDPQSRKTYLENAQRAFSEFRELHPKDARGPGGIAHCLVLKALEKKEKVSPTLRKRIDTLFLEAARLAPEDPLPRYNLGRFLESPVVADFEAAAIAYHSALSRDPEHLPSLLNLAALELQAGRKKKARLLYQRALPLIQDPSERDWVLSFLTKEQDPG